MAWDNPAVQAALIQALSVIIAAMVAAMVGRQVINKRKLQENLALAHQDIAFLLAVEEGHCEHHQKTDGRSMKLHMRDNARERGHIWSGKFTPGRVGYTPPHRDGQ